MRLIFVAGAAVTLLAIAVVAAAATASANPAGAAPAEATPPLHLQGAAFSASEARFLWHPGTDNRYFCLDYAKTLPDLFGRTGSWRNSGCGTTGNSTIVTGLSCGTTYYARVWTSAGGGLYSSVDTVRTYSCETAISPPTNLQVVFVTKSTARLDWDPGKDNRWFCIDTARSQSDLLNFRDTWRNHDCWTTYSQETIHGLRCDTLYYFRIYAWNPIASAHSGVATFRTADCDSKLVLAPIEDVDVDREGSEYFAEITVGKPDTCHSFGSYAADTHGNVIEISVYNTVSDDDACAEVYSTYTLTINLGSGYVSGVTYIVDVNEEESDAFTAR